MTKLLKWILKIVLSILVLLILLLVVLITFKIPVDLTRFKEPVQAMASKALDRPVRIEDSIVVSTSLSPYFTIKGLIIENPEEFATDNFLSMDQATLQIELLPLLKKKIHISKIGVKSLRVTLEETQSGKVNWVFNSNVGSAPSPAPPVEPAPKSQQEKQRFELASDTLVVKQLDLQNISVELHRADQSSPAQFALKSCVGSMVPGKPLNLGIDGSVLDFNYTVDVSIGSLEDLLEYNRSWMEIKANIAETDLSFSGNIDLAVAAKALALQTSIQGANLASLSDLIRIDLPPFADYKIETALHLQPGEIELEKLVVQTGTSRLEGSAEAEWDQSNLVLDMRFYSPLVQLDDFVFENWSLTGEENDDPAKSTSDSEQPAEKSKEEEPDPATSNTKLIDPELLAKLQVSLVIEAEQVFSGVDKLGKGKVEMFIENGSIKVNPLVIELPGGKIEMSSSLRPGKEKSEADLKVLMQNFDIGILARRKQPDSDMGGLVNLDIDLQSSASTIPELLANGNGHFDFSGDLENFSAGIIDLWAVNLVAAIVSNAEKDKSELNCAVGRWSVTDGLLRPDAFVIDTSKIRICADGEVNLKKKQIDLTVKPNAKKPEFFSLATPLEVHGSFSDIGFGLGGGGIVGTAIKFITSPVIVPIKRTLFDEVPADGSDICGMSLGSLGREDLIVPMCTD